MRELYIHYRLRPEAAPVALEMALELQSQLCARHPGLTARLLRRPNEPAGASSTWMEVYTFQRDGAPPGVSRAVEAEIAVAATRLAPFIDGARHIEVFVPCAS